MKKYGDFVHRLMGQDYESPLDSTQHSVILGSSEFVDEIKNRFLRLRKIDRELPAIRKTLERPGLQAIEEAVDSQLELDVRLARQIKMFLCHRYSGKKLKEIGERFSVSESAVTQASRRIGDKLRNDKKLEKLILRIEKRLDLSNV